MLFARPFAIKRRATPKVGDAQHLRGERVPLQSTTDPTWPVVGSTGRRQYTAPPDMQTLPWIVALIALGSLAVVLTAWALKRKPPKASVLPTEWALTARPVFSTDERRVYRLLREALPHHIVLSKLPLVRFCQPTDPNEVRYWFDLLGTGHVTFAICSANGRVLAAIDLDTDRGNSRRLMQIKQSVLAACRVRYLRCPVDQLPSVAELQLLVPSSNAQSRGPQPAPVPSANLHKARDSLSHAVASRRAERTALWQDSTVFQDSFFAPDLRDGFGSSEFAPLLGERSISPHRPEPSRRSGGDTVPDALVGLDVDEPGTGPGAQLARSQRR